ncbi:MAG: GNAT family N-acetyltransferase [bacterium]|nr:MAG: GNAT family N-acetyltransferase [bacterium]
MSLKLVRDPEEGREIWERLIPREFFPDLWEVRWAFHRHFRRPMLFIVEEDGGSPTGLLPLSWIEEQGHYAFFPGETWHGRTWLEQNVIPARSPDRLLAAVPGPYHIRYLSPRSDVIPGDRTVDEIGYLFQPPVYGYDIAGYFDSFSGKSAKRIRREIEAIEAKGLSWRLDHLEDFHTMVSMSVARFGIHSYFSDPRFRNAFWDMVNIFAERGWLRVSTVLVQGEVAAVDLGVLYRGVYTLIAGGTSAAHPGIAKLINLHHMRRACEEGVREVDFLCGDFNWKKMFHLTPRPLYLLESVAAQVA